MHEEISSNVNIKNFSEKDLIRHNAIKFLRRFEGIWLVEGQNGPLSNQSPETRMTGSEVYEWLEGDKFLIYRWNRRFGRDQHIGLGVFGYDENRGSLFADFYDNLGFHRHYIVTVHDGRMHLEGESERATIAVDHEVMNIFWQSLDKGKVSGILCELQGRRNQ